MSAEGSVTVSCDPAVAAGCDSTHTTSGFDPRLTIDQAMAMAREESHRDGWLTTMAPSGRWYDACPRHRHLIEPEFHPPEDPTP